MTTTFEPDDIWVVIQKSGDRDPGIYIHGPFPNQDQAEQFAEWVTDQIDPARACRLLAPIPEFLAWYGQIRERGDDDDDT